MLFMRCADFLVCANASGTARLFQEQKRCLRKAVSSMALIQTDRDNVVRLTNSLPSPALIRLIALGFARRIAQAREFLLWSVRHRLGRLAQGSARRRVRTRLTMAERARQRRALARLSDRELRDIGITRYDIDFVLRHSSRR
jgi:uncharacterized protein YjiS (DUF1127 family)